MIRNYKQHRPYIAPDCYIDDSAQVIGRVRIGAHSSVWPLVTIRGDVNNIEIGSHTNIQDNSVLHVTHEHAQSPAGGYPLIIGSQVTIGHNVILHGCRIGDYCLVGMGSCILDGAVIEDHVLIAAGSLVAQNKQVSSGYLWMGRPARPIRPLNEDELKWLEYSARHYSELKQDYLGQQTTEQFDQQQMFD